MTARLSRATNAHARYKLDKLGNKCWVTRERFTLGERSVYLEALIQAADAARRYADYLPMLPACCGEVLSSSRRKLKMEYFGLMTDTRPL